jgi:hypothetical protein
MPLPEVVLVPEGDDWRLLPLHKGVAGLCRQTEQISQVGSM